MSIKVFVYNNSGVNIDGIVNPKPVQIQPDTENLSAKSYTMTDTYFAQKSLIEIKEEVLKNNMSLALHLISLEQTRAIIRINAKYDQKVEIDTFEIDGEMTTLNAPALTPQNNIAIYNYWMNSVNPEAKKEFIEETTVDKVKK